MLHYTKSTIQKWSMWWQLGNIEWMNKKNLRIFLYSNHFMHPHNFTHFTHSCTLIQVYHRKREELMKLLKHLKCTLLRTFAHHLHWLLCVCVVHVCILNSYTHHWISYNIRYISSCVLSSSWLWNFTIIAQKWMYSSSSIFNGKGT